MKKHLFPTLIIFFIFFSSNRIFAAYLRNVPVKITQPDGQLVDCFASGDEFYNWLHDKNNHTIIKNPDTGYYVFAILKNQELAPSEFIAGKDDPESSGIEPGINVIPERTSLKSAQTRPKSSSHTTGNFNNIVIFIRFADQNEFNKPIADYQNIFNGDDFSLTGYFKEISGNQLNISSTFYPLPQNDWVLSYQDPFNRNYYQAYDASTNPYGYSSMEESDEREHTLLQNAVNFVKPVIEASGHNFDADQDGYVDNICFIIQGDVEGWSDLLWPHRWALYSKQVFINDARVWDYNFQLSARTDVSVLCHEMFHTLGAPDLYHYNFSESVPVGGWDLMAYDNAQHTSTWLKHKYGNWFQNIPEINTNGTYKLAAVSVNPFACFKIPVPESSSEFFMVEYRKKSGYDENLYWNYNEGLLVYRVNTLYHGNAQGPPDEVYVLRPGISDELPAGILGEATFSDFFYRDQLTNTGDPSPFLEDSTITQFRIYDVKVLGDSIEFKYHNGEPLVAGFETSNTEVIQGENIKFTDLSSGEPTSWLWDFGDGSSSTEQNPVHHYQQPGNYTIELRISNSFSSDTIRKNNHITVLPLPDCPQHFQTVWEGTLGYDHMNFNILSAQLDGMDLHPGDEIGIFDGELCVGFGKVEQTVHRENSLLLVASRDDGTGNGFVNGNDITFKVWDCSTSKEFPVQIVQYFTSQLNPAPEQTFYAGSTAFVELNSINDVCLTLDFSVGWNIFSIPSEPDSADLKYLFQPLIENGSLLKIQDESGKALEDYGMLGGWNDDIGEISPTEGYKFKAAVDAGIEICGTPVNYPFAIPLTTGWNIMGFPQPAAVDAMDVLQPLINSGTLQKVQNEAGKAIEDYGMLGGWNNDIGNFEPGKGYKIKLAANDTLWIQEAYPKSTTVLPQSVPTTHFTPDFQGNGIDHMNINLGEIPVNLFQSGDELAVFDGELCVGAVVLLSHHIANQIVSIPASASDEFGMPGFTQGNTFTLKYWSSAKNQEYELEPEILKGTSTFVRHESTLMSLKNLTITGLENNLATNQPEIVCYPNPFSDMVAIEINLAESSEVQIEVLNATGQRIQIIMKKTGLHSGSQRFGWNGENTSGLQVSSGIYVIKVILDEKIFYNKLIYNRLE